MTETGWIRNAWWIYDSKLNSLVPGLPYMIGNDPHVALPGTDEEIPIDMKTVHLVSPVKAPQTGRTPRNDELVCHNCGATVRFYQNLSYGFQVGCDCRSFNVKPLDGQGVQEHYSLPGGLSWEDDPDEWKPYWIRKADQENKNA